ncbi:hypothetical protein B8A33_03850 [Dolosigranulum pigrum]|uniref:YycH family regulatory protein n=1 Tax=Dolosigranulum pigrum TaxID=29394 RepID=UPI000DC0072C|nr:two-component system activity regulator YycH [Dolosigranulum pigrum]RAN56928.1 hypothetical protein B8A33_03850 [Dolosigranulum pigrum]
MTLDRVRHVFLLLLIALSFYISYNIWVPREEGELTSTLQATNQMPAALIERKRLHVYAPAQYILHTDHPEKLPRKQMSEIFEMLMTSVTITELSHSEQFSREEFLMLNEADEEHYLEMIFYTELPIGLFDGRFDNLPSDFANKFFTRLSINLDNPTTLYFYNSYNEEVYRGELDTSKLTEISQLIDTENIGGTPVFPQLIKQDMVYLPEEAQKIAQFDYVMERLPNSLFVSSFFPDTSTVDVRVNNYETRYIDLTTEIRINQVTDILTYLNQLPDLDELTNVERFNNSFYQLSNLENWVEPILLDKYNPDNNILTYRRYIDEYPIFDQQGRKSYVEIGVLEEGLSHLQIPLQITQTPISLDGSKDETLISGREVLDEIESRSTYELSDIEGIQVGLDWTESKESNRVIHFTPKWYVKIDGQWLTLTDLTAESPGDENYEF